MSGSTTTSTEIKSLDQFNSLLKEPKSAYVLHFWASWCHPCVQVDQLLEALLKQNSHISQILRIEAENFPEITDGYNVTAVPAVCTVKNGDLLKVVEGFDPQGIKKEVEALNAKQGGSEKPLNERLKELVQSKDIMLFMKGNPAEPRCGFSRQMVELLNKHFIDYGHFDILSDEEVRQGLKAYSNWPTYPQLYAKGELVGGLDVVRELDDEGELLGELGVEDVNEMCRKLVNSESVMLFMKGNPDQPRCGFSRQMVQLLREQGVENFGHFDILSDVRVRQGLKVFSNWPTYPQLYSNGELIGGLDVVKELIQDDEFKAEMGLE
uniref:Glutaredoxin n=1 Tax=Percolomonas cosmopolitus TaxID=63605 RepID=A0A7S1KMW7_9EUKA|mmetsp:Transcript_11612/g.43626  ORF Transcript_11612/g.43626 Transcript_11612/m.43626 type:complete len:323 (+) Transcript_11612:29-997(+)